jgi:hypothetical protein
MQRFVYSLLCACILAPSASLFAQPTTPCPTNAVFLALQDQVRGYSTRANGPTTPCQIIQGTNTTLTTANSVTVSVNGYLHVLQFLTNGTVDVFLPADNGNVAPNRIESVLNNDLIALATDRNVNDFVLSNRSGPAEISVTEPSTTRAEFAFVAPGYNFGAALTIDKDNNLVVGGYDSDLNALIETMDSSASISSPVVVRTLAGAKTGIYPMTAGDFTHNAMSMAVDPDTGELFVYSYSASLGEQKISVFARGASGNAAPVRVISGKRTTIGPPGTLTNKIAVAADGRLFVAEANNTILVFAPGAKGNVAPAQIISDSTLGANTVGAGGIGVRSCSCH